MYVSSAESDEDKRQGVDRGAAEVLNKYLTYDEHEMQYRYQPSPNLGWERQKGEDHNDLSISSVHYKSFGRSQLWVQANSAPKLSLHQEMKCR